MSKTIDKQRKQISIELGGSFWLGVSFVAGCFGFGWGPFTIVFTLVILMKILEDNNE